MIERFYTVKELVEASGFSKNTLYRAIQSGELKAVLPNGNVRGLRVSESSFNEWLEQNSNR
jgi:excisionase family DNA binding protein